MPRRKGNTLGEAFLQLNRALSGQPDKTAVYKLVTELAMPYPGVAEAHFAVALAGYNTGLGDVEIASASMREIDRALELKPGWDRAVLVKADLLAKSSPDSAIRYLSCDSSPTNRDRGRSQARWRSSMSSRNATARRAPCFNGSSTRTRPIASWSLRWRPFPSR